MKTILAILTLFFAVWMSNANDYTEEYGRIRYLCSQEYRDFYTFMTFENQVDVMVNPYNSSSAILFTETKANVVYTVFFRHYEGVNTIHADLWVGEYFTSIADVIDEIECADSTPPPISIPMYECLGLDPLTLGLPYEGVFTVDNQDYPYMGNLSFLVPLEDVWQWDLYVNGDYVLSFEQSENTPCQIINEANQ